MRTRTWAIVIIINVVVSAIVMFTVLLIWERTQTSPLPDPTTAPVAPNTSIEQGSDPLATSVAPPTATLAAALAATPNAALAAAQYVVRPGDTLSGIAHFYGVSVEALMTANQITDPNMLQVGQTLVIPLPIDSENEDGNENENENEIVTEPQPPPDGETVADAPDDPPAQAPTLTPSGPTLIEIGQVLGAGDLNREVVVIRNGGGAADMEGWTLSDVEGNAFTFPKITLFTNVQMRVHSTTGRSTPSDLYWGRSAPAWGVGKMITLRNQDGDIVDTYIVP